MSRIYLPLRRRLCKLQLKKHTKLASDTKARQRQLLASVVSRRVLTLQLSMSRHRLPVPKTSSSARRHLPTRWPAIERSLTEPFCGYNTLAGRASAEAGFPANMMYTDAIQYQVSEGPMQNPSQLGSGGYYCPTYETDPNVTVTEDDIKLSCANVMVRMQNNFIKKILKFNYFISVCDRLVRLIDSLSLS